jgi:nucleotide-binding universal stress UspA family protein
MFKHLLVPTDGSELSGATVAKAVVFAREAGAKITFFEATPHFPSSLHAETEQLYDIAPQNFEKEAIKLASQTLHKAVAEATAAGVQAGAIEVVSDAPWSAIIEAAKSQQCDLIFMASHGRRGLAALLLGSETQKVLTHSTIPVLVYR